MKLLHLANFHSTNIGNGALILGTERVLREDLGDVTFVPEPWDDYTALQERSFDAAFVRRVNETTDGLLVGAAVTFNGREAFRHAGMRLDLPLELWESFSKPVIFYAISHRMWPHQPYHHLDPFRRTMDTLLQHPQVLFSVRNDGTKTWIESVLGYQSDRIVEIPDPALYVPTADHWHPEMMEGRRTIIVSLNHEDAVYRFGGPLRAQAWRWLSPWVGERRLLRAWRQVPGWQQDRRLILRRVASALERLSRAWDLNIILCPHYFDDDALIAEFASLCSTRLAYQLMVSGGILRVPQAPYFYDLYAKADAVVSMRIHSMSPAIGLGTPCVPLVSQSRMAAFLADTGLADLGVDVFDPDLDERLYERLTDCLQHREDIQQRFRKVVATMRQRTRSFHERIASRRAPSEDTAPCSVATVGGQ